MQTLYVVCYYLIFVSVLLLWLAFKKDFSKLTTLQKFSLVLTSVCIAILFIAGFIEGFMNHFL